MAFVMIFMIPTNLLRYEKFPLNVLLRSTHLKDAVNFLVKYRKIPKISPSMYKPLQIQAPQTRNAKNPPLNRSSKFKPPGGLYLEIALKYKVKQSKNGKFPSTIRRA